MDLYRFKKMYQILLKS